MSVVFHLIPICGWVDLNSCPLLLSPVNQSVSSDDSDVSKPAGSRVQLSLLPHCAPALLSFIIFCLPGLCRFLLHGLSILLSMAAISSSCLLKLLPRCLISFNCTIFSFFCAFCFLCHHLFSSVWSSL